MSIHSYTNKPYAILFNGRLLASPHPMLAYQYANLRECEFAISILKKSSPNIFSKGILIPIVLNLTNHIIDSKSPAKL